MAVSWYGEYHHTASVTNQILSYYDTRIITIQLESLIGQYHGQWCLEIQPATQIDLFGLRFKRRTAAAIGIMIRLHSITIRPNITNQIGSSQNYSLRFEWILNHVSWEQTGRKHWNDCTLKMDRMHSSMWEAHIHLWINSPLFFANRGNVFTRSEVLAVCLLMHPYTPSAFFPPPPGA